MRRADEENLAKVLAVLQFEDEVAVRVLDDEAVRLRIEEMGVP